MFSRGLCYCAYTESTNRESGAHRNRTTVQIFQRLIPYNFALHSHFVKLYYLVELEMPLQNSLCNMEMIGFPANEAALRKIFQQMLETMKKLEFKIYEMHGGRFNLGSSAAVAKVMRL